MLQGHFRRTMHGAIMSAGAQAFVMIVAHKDKARLPGLGQDDRLTAGSIGYVTNLFVESPVVNWRIEVAPIGLPGVHFAIDGR